MPRRAVSREIVTATQRSQTTGASDRPPQSGRVLRVRSRSAGHGGGHRTGQGHDTGHGAGHPETMPPQETRMSRRRTDISPMSPPDCRLSAEHTEHMEHIEHIEHAEHTEHTRHTTEILPGLEEPPLSPVSSVSEDPDSPPRRRLISPERVTRSASPESASRLARRAKRRRRLHDEPAATTEAETASNSGARPAVRSARRCLFGRPDHAQLDRALREEERELRRAESLRWNFDFVRGRPLEGPWRWESVQPLNRPS